MLCERLEMISANIISSRPSRLSIPSQLSIEKDVENETATSLN